MADFMRSQLDYIFFFYGLAFILLAPICQILRRRPQPQPPWVWLGAFGVVHGVNELIGLLTLGLVSNTAFDLARLVLATGSFIFLMEFGRAGTLTFRGRGPGHWILAALLGVSLLGFFAGFSGFSAVSRYVLGFGGGLWAAGTLWLASKAPGAGKRVLQGAALGMLGYALTNLVVTPAPFFPAAQLNSASFLALTGLPIQLVKGLLALWLSVCLVLLADVSLPRETGRRIRVWSNILMLGGLVAVTALLVAGWFTTQYFSDDALKDIRTKQESHVKILSRFMTDKMEEAEKLANTMAESPWIAPALEHKDTLTIAQANSILDRYSLTLPGSVCYVMDLNGLTIASSNRHQPDSFVGMSYQFRPYFQQAITGTPGRYWALGVTSKELGFYASYPVRNRAGKIVGVAAFKRPIGKVEGFFPTGTLGFVIDSHGIVIMANRPEMVLQSLWPLAPETREKLPVFHQFGPGPFTPILTREPVDRAEARFQGTRQLVLRQPFPWEDWSIVILDAFRPIVLGRLMGITIILFVCSGVIAFLTILGLTIDTAARIQSSESKYKLVFQNNPVGIFQFDETGTVTDCNDKFAQIIGAPKEKIIGFNLPRQLQNERIREMVLASMQGGCGFYEGDYLSILGGKLTSVRAISQGILSPANEFLGGVGIFEDITVRRQALEALRESEEKFRLVFEKAPLGIMHYDLTSTITDCNEKFAEIIGAPKENFIGFNMMRQLNDDKMREALSASLKGEVGYYEGEYLSVTAGKATLVRAIFQPIFSLDGALSGGVTIFEDITERKRAEEEIARLASFPQLNPNPVLEVDASGEITFSNQAALEIVRVNGLQDATCILPADMQDILRTARAQRQTEFFREIKVQDKVFAERIHFISNFQAGHVYIEDITERKQAEEALRASEERYRTVADYTYDMEYWVDPDGNVLYMSPACERLTGYSSQAFQEDPQLLFQILHPEDQARFVNHLQDEIYRNEPVNLDFRLLHRTGQEFWVSHSCQPVFGADGHPLGRRAANRDITDKKRSEEILLREKQFSDMTIEGLPGLFYLFDDKGNFLRWNSNFEQASGYSGQELAKMKPWDFFMGQEQQEIQAAVREVFQKGFTVAEADFVSKDGRKTPYFFTGKLSILGERQCLLGMGIDVTARKEAEEAFQSLVNYAPIGIYIVQHGKFAMINPGFEAITGHTAPDLLGQDCLNSVSPGYRAFVREQAIQRLKGEGLPPYEYQFLNQSGESGWVMETVTPTQYKGQRAVLGYFMDITPLKRLEAQFLQAQKMEAVGRLAGGIAHDFNNILGVIIGYAEIMWMGLKEDDPLCGYLGEIKRAAVRAASLTRQLLAFSRRQIQQIEVINVNEVVIDLETMVHRLIGEDLELIMQLDSAPLFVKADKGQVEQIILNLAVNAKDAMPQGGKLTIATGDVYLDETYCRDHPYVSPGPFVMLSVNDNGIGMDEETQAHIFEPFFTTKDIGKGTGLGLSTVFGIVKQSGGSIEVDSEAGVGTTVKVYLPGVAKSVEEPQAEICASPLSGHETILVVEDDDGLRPLMIDVFKIYGYEVLEARDGDEALHICKDHEGPIHLLVTDVVMPRMSGRQLAEQVAELYPQMQVLFMSGYTDNAIVHHGVLHEDTEYIQKPFSPDDLAKKVREVLATSFSK